MINNYFHYITISNGGVYSYNFKRKKVIVNPTLHLPIPLQSANFYFYPWPGRLGQFGRFSTTYVSDRLDEPNYVADILYDLTDELLDFKDNNINSYPEISKFELSRVD